MGISIVPVPSSASTPALSVGVPVGLTLRNTYTSTTSGLSFPVSQVYAILVGGIIYGNILLKPMLKNNIIG